MAYSETPDGQVMLTMSREDYDRLLMLLGEATGHIMQGDRSFFSFDVVIGLLNRLNSGNPNYTPYRVDDKI